MFKTGGPRNLRTFYLRICLFTFKIGEKLQFSSQNWTFYLQIQDSRSKMTERIYRELRGKPVIYGLCLRLKFML